MDEKIQNFKKELGAIKERNRRVEADKAWEISSFRVFLITIIIYLIAAIVLYFIAAKNFLLNALVPALGYWLSTQSLPFIKRWWVKRFWRR